MSAGKLSASRLMYNSLPIVSPVLAPPYFPLIISTPSGIVRKSSSRSVNMVKRCSVCSHPSRPDIDLGLMHRVPYRALAAQFGLSPSALSRHIKHLARQRRLQQRLDDQSHQAALLDKLALLETRLDRLFNSALNHHSLNVALGCIRQSLRLLSLLERSRLDPGGPS
jgi:hypothetical protein